MKWLLFLISFLATLLLYRPILNLSFTQDDWFLLRQVKFNSPREQLAASLPNADSIYFRPLGMQGYFYLTYRLFNLHVWAYRLATIMVHSLNAILIFSLLHRLFSSAFLSISISLLYLSSPLHFVSLGWLANISFVTGAFMTLFTVKTAIDGHKKRALACFIAGLLTNELVLTAPFLLILVVAAKNRHFPLVSRATWMFVVGTAYVLLRLLSSRADDGAYELTLDPRLIAQNIRWLFLWSLGWPETVRDHFVSLFSMRKEFLQTFPRETVIFSATTLVSLGLMLNAICRKPRIILCFVWFLVSIAPIIFFRSHVSPHYAMIGSIGLYVLIASGLRHLRPMFKLLFLSLWLTQSLAAFRVNLITHWWVQHSRLAGDLVSQATWKFPELPKNKMIALENHQPDRAAMVLAGDSAMQILYNDPAVKTVFVAK